MVRVWVQAEDKQQGVEVALSIYSAVERLQNVKFPGMASDDEVSVAVLAGGGQAKQQARSAAGCVQSLDWMAMLTGGEQAAGAGSCPEHLQCGGAPAEHEVPGHGV